MNAPNGRPRIFIQNFRDLNASSQIEFTPSTLLKISYRYKFLELLTIICSPVSPETPHLFVVYFQLYVYNYIEFIPCI